MIITFKDIGREFTITTNDEKKVNKIIEFCTGLMGNDIMKYQWDGLGFPATCENCGKDYDKHSKDGKLICLGDEGLK